MGRCLRFIKNFLEGVSYIRIPTLATLSAEDGMSELPNKGLSIKEILKSDFRKSTTGIRELTNGFERKQ